MSRDCTLTPAAVRTLATQAVRDGLGVQLRPIIRVGPRSGWNDPGVSWEGSIRPANQRAWFASLLAAERPYLEILRSIPGSEFVAGTELDGVASSPQWTSFIRQAQAICGCQVEQLPRSTTRYARGIVPPVPNPGVDWYPHLEPSRYCPAVNCDRRVEIESGPHSPATAQADVPGRGRHPRHRRSVPAPGGVGNQRLRRPGSPSAGILLQRVRPQPTTT